MKKFNFPVGRKVKGYGVLNEYGEFDFIPEQTGSRNGVVKLIKAGEGFSVKHTQKCVMVHITIDKGDKLTTLKKFMQMSSQVLLILRDYEI